MVNNESIILHKNGVAWQPTEDKCSKELANMQFRHTKPAKFELLAKAAFAYNESRRLELAI